MAARVAHIMLRSAACTMQPDSRGYTANESSCASLIPFDEYCTNMQKPNWACRKDTKQVLLRKCPIRQHLKGSTIREASNTAKLNSLARYQPLFPKILCPPNGCDFIHQQIWVYNTCLRCESFSQWKKLLLRIGSQ